MTTAWTRADVWFAHWPRRGVDLDIFLSSPDGPYPEMQGSHRCHHGLCINPNHPVYEPKLVNLSRQKCAVFAKRLRRYGFSIPEHCQDHEPACLMQV